MTSFRGTKPSLDVQTEAVLQPFFMHAQFVYGGIQLKEDATAVIHVRTADDNNAKCFAEKLTNSNGWPEPLPNNRRRRRNSIPWSAAWPTPSCTASAEISLYESISRLKW
jgi:hypothetical protein